MFWKPLVPHVYSTSICVCIPSCIILMYADDLCKCFLYKFYPRVTSTRETSVASLNLMHFQTYSQGQEWKTQTIKYTALCNRGAFSNEFRREIEFRPRGFRYFSNFKRMSVQNLNGVYKDFLIICLWIYWINTSLSCIKVVLSIQINWHFWRNLSMLSVFLRILWYSVGEKVFSLVFQVQMIASGLKCIWQGKNGVQFF